MNILVPSVITLRGRSSGNFVGDFDSTLGPSVSASIGNSSVAASTTTSAAPGAGFSWSGFASGLTGLVSAVANPLVSLKLQDAQYGAQAKVATAQANASIAQAAAARPAPQIFYGAGNTPAAPAGMSTATKIAIGGGAALLVLGVVVLATRSRRN